MLPLERFRRVARAIANLEYDYELNEASPEFCAHLLIYPNIKVYKKLHKKLQTSTRAWIHEFIEHDGLFSLMQSIENPSNNYKNSGFINSLLISKCLNCIKELMNTKLGMESLITMTLEDVKYTQMFAKSSQPKRFNKYLITVKA